MPLRAHRRVQKESNKSRIPLPIRRTMSNNNKRSELDVPRKQRSKVVDRIGFLENLYTRTIMYTSFQTAYVLPHRFQLHPQIPPRRQLLRVMSLSDPGCGQSHPFPPKRPRTSFKSSTVTMPLFDGRNLSRDLLVVLGDLLDLQAYCVPNMSAIVLWLLAD